MTTNQKKMSTTEVAKRLTELCRTGQILQAQEELFSDDVSSIEPANSMSKSANGKKAVAQKGAEFASMIEQRHGGTFSDPVISGNFFSAAMSLDATIKGKGRMTLDEICVYEVKDGKIILEQFFF